MVRRRLVSLCRARARRADPVARPISAPPPAPFAKQNHRKKNQRRPARRAARIHQTAKQAEKEGDGEPKTKAKQRIKFRPENASAQRPQSPTRPSLRPRASRRPHSSADQRPAAGASPKQNQRKKTIAGPADARRGFTGPLPTDKVQPEMGERRETHNARSQAFPNSRSENFGLKCFPVKVKHSPRA